MTHVTRSAAYAFLLFAAASCTSERGFDVDPPVVQLGNAIPVAPVTNTDVIVQVVPPIVDILWTIDNSCSMAEEQAALTLNFPRFMSYFVGSGLDYHVGVISTDLDDDDHEGKLLTYTPKGSKIPLRFIDTKTENPVEVFEGMATLGTDGSGIEKGRGAVYTALEILRLEPPNIGFYRQEASLHTILISDEDDDTDDRFIERDEFVAWYRALKSGGWRRTFSSIVNEQNGDDYLKITADVGGIPWNIGTEEWDVVLDRLGVEASGLRREFYLSQRPVVETIEVSVTQEIEGVEVERVLPIVDENDNVVLGSWLYDQSRNSIRFDDFTPDPLAEIKITYTLLSSTLDAEL